MPQPRRYYVRSTDGAVIQGFDDRRAAVFLAGELGDGALLVDTIAQAYQPMLSEVVDGEVQLAGFGGWDTGRPGALGRDLIEAVKKGHVAIVHAFLAKGADIASRGAGGGGALHWAVASGKADVVRLLLAHGADPAAPDDGGVSALDLARKKPGNGVLEVLESGA